jgi:signal transduction histidine kinase
MNTRSWPIRSKITALVIVPLAALMALWIFATTLTIGPALNLLAAQNLLDNVGVPGEALVRELTYERRLSLIYLAGGADTELREQRKRTDEAIAEFRSRVTRDRVRDDLSDVLAARLDQTLAALDVLPSARNSIDRKQMDKAAALSLYSSIISSAFQAFYVLATLPDEDITRQARALTMLGQARELLSQADALVAGAYTAGEFTAAEHAEFVQLVGSRHHLSSIAVAELPATTQVTYHRMTESEPFVRMQEMEEKLIAGGTTLPDIDPEMWWSTHEAVQQQMREFELGTSDVLAEASIPVAVRILLRLLFAGVLGLVAVIVSIIVAVRIGRSLVRRLTGLRSAALELANERLPSVVERLRRGEAVDVAAETPDLSYGDDEIGQVAMAFREVQRTAVQSAIDEAAARQGLNEVFLNIARRSQTLLHRQLSLLDKMERRTTDPEELEDLFRVDHLATRMRRHAEDLVILAGANPGRTWRNPIAMIDVIRGAVSEVEDYVRIDITSVQPAATVGRAVADVIHLLAELIENATLFSPPHTRVRISGQEVPNGYAIEIEDRGLGMTAEEIQEANCRLASPPEFDPTNSARLGLFVVARLAARHGVKVQLRQSPYGGITAIVLLPREIVVPADEIVPATHVQAAAAVPASSAALPAAQDMDATQEIPLALPEPRTVDCRSRLAQHRSVAPQPSDAAVLTTVRTGEEEKSVSDDDSPSPTPELTNEGLPRRRRQRRTAPQLRMSATLVRPRIGDLPVARTPEQIRAAMSALQAGTLRGRRESEAASAILESNMDGPGVSDGGSADPGRNE